MKKGVIPTELHQLRAIFYSSDNKELRLFIFAKENTKTCPRTSIASTNQINAFQMIIILLILLYKCLKTPLQSRQKDTMKLFPFRS